MTTSKNAPPREIWDKIRSKRRESWKAGQRVRVETIVKQLPALALDPTVLAEMAFQEFCLREERGEAPRTEEFAERFPTCADKLKQLLIEIGRWR